MWVIHNCLALHGSCNPTSWGDVAEMFCAAVAAAVALPALGLLGEWLSSLF